LNKSRVDRYMNSLRRTKKSGKEDPEFRKVGQLITHVLCFFSSK